jgi:hypothetical protein
MSDSDYEWTSVDPAKVQAVIALLQMFCQGPAEAYTTLIVAIVELDKLPDCGGHPSRQALADECHRSILSVTEDNGTVQ